MILKNYDILQWTKQNFELILHIFNDYLIFKASIKYTENIVIVFKKNVHKLIETAFLVQLNIKTCKKKYLISIFKKFCTKFSSQYF